MKTITDFWNFLDGKKTTIGAIILFIGAFLTEVPIGQWHITSVWLIRTADVFNYVGMAAGGIGLGHKIYKAPQDSSIGQKQTGP